MANNNFLVSIARKRIWKDLVGSTFWQYWLGTERWPTLYMNKQSFDPLQESHGALQKLNLTVQLQAMGMN